MCVSAAGTLVTRVKKGLMTGMMHHPCDAVSNNYCASYALVTFLYIGDMLMRFETDACSVNVPIIKLVVRLDRGEDRGGDRGDDRTEEIDQGCSVGVPHVRWW